MTRCRSAGTFRRLGPGLETAHTEPGMSIALHREFTVHRTADRVWSFLTTPESLAACVPGAQLLEISDDRFSGEVDLGLGPLRTRLRGRAVFEELDAERRIALLSGEADEVDGDGGAQLRMRSRLGEAGPLTEVEMWLAVRLSGRLDGPIVRRVLGGASEILFRRFVSCVKERLEAG